VCVLQVLPSTEDSGTIRAHISAACQQVSVFTGDVWNDSKNARQHQECVNVGPERFSGEHSTTFGSYRRNCYETGELRCYLFESFRLLVL